jgi:hypothetical protein
MTAPKGNLNAARNGGRLTRLTLGELPLSMRRQTREARKYRRGLEGLVFDEKGEVTPTDAHLIDEAATAEVHAAVCRWLLRERLDTMSVQDVLTCSREILKAKTTRNRAVERLGIGERPDAIDALYNPIPDDPPESPQDAPGTAGSPNPSKTPSATTAP